MDEELGPVDQPRVDLFESFAVILRKFYALPHFRGGVGALDDFHVEVEDASRWVGADGGIAGVGERAGLTVAEAGDIVFVAAEGLFFGGSVVWTLIAVAWLVESIENSYLSL